MKQKILDYINKENRLMPISQVKKHFSGISKSVFNNFLNTLIDQGKIIRNNRGKVMPFSLSKFVVAKIVSCSSSAFFAKPVDPGGEDIYISFERAKGAMVTDTVLVGRIRIGRFGKSGTVQKVLEQGRREISGTFFKKAKNMYVISNLYKMKIPVKLTYTLGAADLDRVSVKLFYPKGSYSIYAKVIKIFGSSGQAKTAADAIIDELGIPTVFTEEAKKLAKDLNEKGIPNSELENRVDLRDEVIFTIDGEDAKDLDDAISGKETETGYVVGVHIADVSYYVGQKSTVDIEAFERGTSVYFADRVIPMLPKDISNGICSLNENVDRLTFSCFAELDKEGNILNYQFKKSVINSKVRGVYSETNSILEGKASQAIKDKYKSVMSTLLLAQKIANLLEKKAVAEGKLEFTSKESKFKLNENGMCVGLEPRFTGVSENIIENFMILANQCAAKLAQKANLPFIYRVHEEPDPVRVLELFKSLSILGFELNKKVLTKSSPKDFIPVLNKAKGTPLEKVVSDLILRSMSKARYFSSPLGHFGLSLKDYCHFTSPIRRYPDLFIHRRLKEYIDGASVTKMSKAYSQTSIETALNCSTTEVRAQRAERDTEKFYKAEYMKQFEGESFEGLVSGILESGVFVELENTAEGFVPAAELFEKGYAYNDKFSFVRKSDGEKIMIGSKLSVEVMFSNVSTGKIDFSLK